MIDARFLLATAFLIAIPGQNRADIFRWDNNQVIPGTEGTVPGPGVQLDHRALAYAQLNLFDLTDSRFDFADLSYAALWSSTLTNANMLGANLDHARLDSSALEAANMSAAVVTNADLSSTTSRGFTKDQLYSTASYQQKELVGIGLGSNDLSDWDFQGQRLVGARLEFSALTNANLTNANLANASFHAATLTNANLSGAVVTGTNFALATTLDFTKEQLYSTASYQAKNLQGIGLSFNDLSDWDFSDQNLTNASLLGSTVRRANLSGAIVTEAVFDRATYFGFTKEQLYSTASYLQKNLQGIALRSNSLLGWDFRGQNLTNAVFSNASLSNANLSGAIVNGANFAGTTSLSFIAEQLYSTASYQARDLHGIVLDSNDLSGWDFGDQDLTSARLDSATLTHANFGGAVVTNSSFRNTTAHGFVKEQLYSTASYRAKNLKGIGLTYNDLSDWDFSGQNLTNADLSHSALASANFSGADLRGARPFALAGTTSHNAILPDGSITGLHLSMDDQLLVRNYQGDAGRQLEPIPLTIHDNLTMERSGVLKLLFDADAWNSTIHFQSGIPVALDGVVELKFENGVNLRHQVGRTFNLFDWSGVNPVGQMQVASPYAWNLTNLYTSGEVTLVAVAEPSSNVLVVTALTATMAFRYRRRSDRIQVRNA